MGSFAHYRPPHQKGLSKWLHLPAYPKKGLSAPKRHLKKSEVSQRSDSRVHLLLSEWACCGEKLHRGVDISQFWHSFGGGRHEESSEVYQYIGIFKKKNTLGAHFLSISICHVHGLFCPCTIFIAATPCLSGSCFPQLTDLDYLETAIECG